jgi:hypothetical protein
MERRVLVVILCLDYEEEIRAARLAIIARFLILS